MAKGFKTRLQVQEILEQNSLGASVSYRRRKATDSPDNYIIYYRLTPNETTYADDQIHMRKVLVQVTHFHKKSLDNIMDLMRDNFQVEPIPVGNDVPDIATDYLADYYRFELFTDSRW